MRAIDANVVGQPRLGRVLRDTGDLLEAVHAVA